MGMGSRCGERSGPEKAMKERLTEFKRTVKYFTAQSV
jgi:hypothetical protein